MMRAVILVLSLVRHENFKPESGASTNKKIDEKVIEKT